MQKSKAVVEIVGADAPFATATTRSLSDADVFAICTPHRDGNAFENSFVADVVAVPDEDPPYAVIAVDTPNILSVNPLASTPPNLVAIWNYEQSCV